MIGYVKIQDLLREVVNAKYKTNVVLSGINALDEAFARLYPESLIIIGARPGMGKTALALNIAQCSAADAGASVMIFSLEMSRERIAHRLLSMKARVEMSKIKTWDIEAKDVEKINYALNELGKTKIVVDDTPNISIEQMRDKCRKLKHEQGLDIVIIDYLQLIAQERDIRTCADDKTDLIRELKILAREIGCHVIVTSQLSRKLETRKNKWPELTDFNDPDAIEQYADVVALLYRDDYYHWNSDRPGTCEIDVVQNKNGPIGTIDLVWIDKWLKLCDWPLII